MTDLVHFLTPNQFDEQVRFLMNGVVMLSNMRSLNVETLNAIRDKNMFIFGSTHHKTIAFEKFLKLSRGA